MPVNYDPDSATSSHVQDVDSIGREAKSKKDRRSALRACVDNQWAADDIGLVERVETATKWGWTMHPYRRG